MFIIHSFYRYVNDCLRIDKNYGKVYTIKNGGKMERLKKLIVPAAIIGVAYLIFTLIGVGCPIKFITGVSCPGCGITRAFLSLIKLDLAAAFYYHPLFPLAAILVVMFVLNELGKIRKKTFDISVYVISAAFIIAWILRFFFSDGAIVSFNPSENIIFRVLDYIGALR